MIIWFHDPESGWRYRAVQLIGDALYPIVRCLTIPREPDFVIGAKDRPYLRRWWVIPRNRFFNIYLHQILRDDDDRALHCHPWWNLSIILRNGYIEHTQGGVKKIRHPFVPVLRRATAQHRLELFKSRWKWRGIGKSRKLVLEPIVPCWSLFITGPKIREWGFHCPQGFRHWRDYIGVPSGEARGDERGPGCAD